MFCSRCGSPLAADGLVCSNCLKPCIRDEPTGTFALQPMPPEPEFPTRPDPAAPAAVDERNRPKRYANCGSITLGVVALVCLVLGAVQGFIPIFLIEGVAFGGLAWLCAARWPLSEGLLSVVLVSSLLIAGLVGVTLDQDSFGPRYRYLTQGNQELRVDEKAGRTDRLAVGSWVPVAFDKPSQDISKLGGNVIDDLFAVQLSDGSWSSGGLSGRQEVCFTLKNSSNFVIQSVFITVTTQQKDDPNNKPTSSEQVVLKSQYDRLIPRGASDVICGAASHVFAPGESWTYSEQEVLGWK